MEQQRLAFLMGEWMNKAISEADYSELIGFLQANRQEPVVAEIFQQMMEQESMPYEAPVERWDAHIDQILNVDKHINTVPILFTPKRSVFRMDWIKYAAVIILIAGTGAYLWLSNTRQKRPAPVVTVAMKNDVGPGKDGAVLTLADGRQVVLDSAGNGLIATQNGSEVTLKNGYLTYKATDAVSETVTYNTMATPKGRQFQVVLPDGTKVWLNAASSLRFPASFSIKERRVELSGEAYFEVASQMGHGKKVPFIVHVSSASSANGMDVEVVGTHFNIMSYADEQNIKTTLLEGKVKVSQDGITRNLEPGRQAIVDHQTHAITVANANVEQAVAWKEGQFRFKETGINELMRQVARWYNVEVEYRTNRTDQDYTGIVSRTENVSSILKMLEATGTVHFMVEKTKIIVLP